MSDWFSSTAGSGSLVLAVPVALIAGLVSFFSPCVIPLLPGYLSYATGLSGAELAEERTAREHRGRMMLGSTLFVLGFTVVFVLLGLASGTLGRWAIDFRREINVGLGAFSILLGLVFAGWLPLLGREWRVHAVPAVGLLAAPMLGFFFGLGWLPCVGPTLAVILNLGFNEGTASRSALLSACYALGLGLPFIVAGAAYQRMLGAVAWVRRHQRWVMRLGGLMMIAVGVLLLTGWWDQLVTWVQVHLVSGFQVVV